MKAIWRVGLPLIVLLALVSTGIAETELELSGQVRVRSELDNKSFHPDVNSNIFEIMRTRVGLKATKNEFVHAFVQLQDSRMLGGRDQFGEWQSGTLNDGKGVDLHQAYIQIDRLWVDGLGFKGGRFEFNLGNQRVFGSVGWHNVGRSWEGGMAWYKSEQFKLTAFGFKAQEENDTWFERDYDVFGLHLGLKEIGLELLGVLEVDNDTLQVDNLNDNDLDRFSIGLFYGKKFDQLDLELNTVYQTGKQADELDIAAFMAAGELGFRFEGERNGRVAFGVDYASGDDDLTDTEAKAYNNLYYTGHKFRGYMDYFVGSKSYGLMDLMFRFKVDPAKKWTLKGDFHYFTAAQNYLDPLDLSETKDIGMEFDFSLSTSSVAGVKLVTGASVFLPQDSFARMYLGNSSIEEGETAFWSYTQAIIDF